MRGRVDCSGTDAPLARQYSYTPEVKVVVDFTAPKLVHSSPAEGGVLLARLIELRFHEDVICSAPAEAEVTQRLDNGTNRTVNSDLVCQGSLVMVTLSEKPALSSRLQLAVRGLRDVYGNEAQEAEFQFTVRPNLEDQMQQMQEELDELAILKTSLAQQLSQLTGTAAAGTETQHF